MNFHRPCLPSEEVASPRLLEAKLPAGRCFGTQAWLTFRHETLHSIKNPAGLYPTGISNGVYSDRSTVERFPKVEKASPSEGFSLGSRIPDSPKKGLVSGKSSWESFLISV